MAVAAYRDRATGRYPLTIVDIRAASPALFGEEPTQEVLDAVEADPVEASAQPAFNPATQALSEGNPVFDGETWRQTWTVTDLPPPPVPIEVTKRQAKLMLSRAGLLSSADAAIAAMVGQAGEEARIDWSDASTFRRDNPLIAGIGSALGLTSSQIDGLFVEAAKIP